MLKIRSAQIESFESAMLESFCSRTETHLRGLFPNEVRQLETRQKLRQVITQGIDDAARYRIENEEDVTRFLELAVLLGPGFDREPDYMWATLVLENDEDSAEDRLDAIFEFIHFSDEGESE